MLICKDYSDVPTVQRGPRLLWNNDVERTFKDLIRSGEEMFLEKEDRRLMRAIDGAHRVDDYTVRTPYGQSCITCLCTGGKLGLLLLFYSRKGIVPEVSYHAAGENVWKWLAEDPKLEICIAPDEESERYFQKFLGDKADKKDVWDLYFEKEAERYDMTKEKEAAAYERYSKKGQHPTCGIGELLDGKVFRQRFGEGYWEDAENTEFDTYTIFNQCPVLWEELHHRRHPFYIIGRRRSDNQLEVQHGLACKFSTFMEVLRNEMMVGYFDCEKQEHQQCMDLYSSWFCLLLDCDERWPVLRYTDIVLCGVEINPANKTIDIYAKEEAIEIFHEGYQKCQNV